MIYIYNVTFNKTANDQSSIVIIHHEQNIESIKNKLNFYCNISRHIALLLAGYSALFYTWLYYSVFIN